MANRKALIDAIDTITDNAELAEIWCNYIIIRKDICKLTGNLTRYDNVEIDWQGRTDKQSVLDIVKAYTGDYELFVTNAKVMGIIPESAANDTSRVFNKKSYGTYKDADERKIINVCLWYYIEVFNKAILRVASTWTGSNSSMSDLLYYHTCGFFKTYAPFDQLRKVEAEIANAKSRIKELQQKYNESVHKNEQLETKNEQLESENAQLMKGGYEPPSTQVPTPMPTQIPEKQQALPQAQSQTLEDTIKATNQTRSRYLVKSKELWKGYYKKLKEIYVTLATNPNRTDRDKLEQIIKSNKLIIPDRTDFILNVVDPHKKILNAEFVKAANEVIGNNAKNELTSTLNPTIEQYKSLVTETMNRLTRIMDNYTSTQKSEYDFVLARLNVSDDTYGLSDIIGKIDRYYRMIIGIINRKENPHTLAKSISTLDDGRLLSIDRYYDMLISYLYGINGNIDTVNRKFMDLLNLCRNALKDYYTCIDRQLASNYSGTNGYNKYGIDFVKVIVVVMNNKKFDISSDIRITSRDFETMTIPKVFSYVFEQVANKGVIQLLVEILVSLKIIQSDESSQFINIWIRLETISIIISNISSAYGDIFANSNRLQGPGNDDNRPGPDSANFSNNGKKRRMDSNVAIGTIYNNTGGADVSNIDKISGILPARDILNAFKIKIDKLDKFKDLTAKFVNETQIFTNNPIQLVTNPLITDDELDTINKLIEHHNNINFNVGVYGRLLDTENAYTSSSRISGFLNSPFAHIMNTETNSTTIVKQLVASIVKMIQYNNITIICILVNNNDVTNAERKKINKELTSKVFKSLYIMHQLLELYNTGSDNVNKIKELYKEYVEMLIDIDTKFKHSATIASISNYVHGNVKIEGDISKFSNAFDLEAKNKTITNAPNNEFKLIDVFNNDNIITKLHAISIKDNSQLKQLRTLNIIIYGLIAYNDTSKKINGIGYIPVISYVFDKLKTNVNSLYTKLNTIKTNAFTTITITDELYVNNTANTYNNTNDIDLPLELIDSMNKDSIIDLFGFTVMYDIDSVLQTIEHFANTASDVLSIAAINGMLNIVNNANNDEITNANKFKDAPQQYTNALVTCDGEYINALCICQDEYASYDDIHKFNHNLFKSDELQNYAGFIPKTVSVTNVKDTNFGNVYSIVMNIDGSTDTFIRFYTSPLNQNATIDEIGYKCMLINIGLFIKLNSKPTVYSFVLLLMVIILHYHSFYYQTVPLAAMYSKLKENAKSYQRMYRDGGTSMELKDVLIDPIFGNIDGAMHHSSVITAEILIGLLESSAYKTYDDALNTFFRNIDNITVLDKVLRPSGIATTDTYANSKIQFTCDFSSISNDITVRLAGGANTKEIMSNINRLAVMNSNAIIGVLLHYFSQSIELISNNGIANNKVMGGISPFSIGVEDPYKLNNEIIQDAVPFYVIAYNIIMSYTSIVNSTETLEFEIKIDQFSPLYKIVGMFKNNSNDHPFMSFNDFDAFIGCMNIIWKNSETGDRVNNAVYRLIGEINSSIVIDSLFSSQMDKYIRRSSRIYDVALNEKLNKLDTFISKTVGGLVNNASEITIFKNYIDTIVDAVSKASNAKATLYKYITSDGINEYSSIICKYMEVILVPFNVCISAYNKIFSLIMEVESYTIDRHSTKFNEPFNVYNYKVIENILKSKMNNMTLTANQMTYILPEDDLSSVTDIAVSNSKTINILPILVIFGSNDLNFRNILDAIVNEFCNDMKHFLISIAYFAATGERDLHVEIDEIQKVLTNIKQELVTKTYVKNTALNVFVPPPIVKSMRGDVHNGVVCSPLNIVNGKGSMTVKIHIAGTTLTLDTSDKNEFPNIDNIASPTMSWSIIDWAIFILALTSRDTTIPYTVYQNITDSYQLRNYVFEPNLSRKTVAYVLADDGYKCIITQNIMFRSKTETNINATSDIKQLSPTYIGNMVSIIPIIVATLKTYANSKEMIDINYKEAILVLKDILVSYYNLIIQYCPSTKFMEEIGYKNQNVYSVSAALKLSNNNIYEISNKLLWCTKYCFGSEELMYPQLSIRNVFKDLYSYLGQEYSGIKGDCLETTLAIMGKCLMFNVIFNSMTTENISSDNKIDKTVITNLYKSALLLNRYAIAAIVNELNNELKINNGVALAILNNNCNTLQEIDINTAAVNLDYINDIHGYTGHSFFIDGKKLYLGYAINKGTIVVPFKNVGDKSFVDDGVINTAHAGDANDINIPGNTSDTNTYKAQTTINATKDYNISLILNLPNLEFINGIGSLLEILKDTHIRLELGSDSHDLLVKFNNCYILFMFRATEIYTEYINNPNDGTIKDNIKVLNQTKNGYITKNIVDIKVIDLSKYISFNNSTTFNNVALLLSTDEEFIKPIARTVNLNDLHYCNESLDPKEANVDMLLVSEKLRYALNNFNLNNMLPIKPQDDATSRYLTLSLNNYINMHKVLFGFQDYLSLYSNIYNLSELLQNNAKQRTIRDIIVGIYNNDKIPLITSTIASLMPGAYVYSQIGKTILENLSTLNLPDRSIDKASYKNIIQNCIEFHDGKEHSFIDRYKYTIFLILAYIDIVTSNKSITNAEQEDVVKITKALSFKSQF